MDQKGLKLDKLSSFVSEKWSPERLEVEKNASQISINESCYNVVV